MIKIAPSDLVDMGQYAGTHPLRVDLVYAQPEHPENIFKTGIYRPDAKLWAHSDLAAVVLRAAQICHDETGYFFSLKDCLRTTDAQQRIVDSAIVRANPGWLEEPRLFSLPGGGGHPRGMAVDITLQDEAGHEIDMGTPFDYMMPDRAVNPAARDYLQFGAAVLENRKTLENAMLRAGTELGRAILPLPEEWWDFRFMPSYTAQFAPIADADLSPAMRMT